MIQVLVDHNMEGQAVLLWGTLATDGWLALLPLELVTFKDVDLAFDTTDRQLWRFAQERGMLLLTINRSMRESESLEQTIRAENTDASLPVITVANADRLEDKAYREACALRLVEIALDLDDFRGAGRLYIP